MKIEKVDIDVFTWDEVELQTDDNFKFRSWSDSEVVFREVQTGKDEIKKVARGFIFYENSKAIGFHSSKNGDDFVVVNNTSQKLQVMDADEIYDVYGFKIDKDGIS